MGCYVDKKGNPKDTCVISRDYNKPNHYYVFNHMGIVISYHDGHGKDWGEYLSTGKQGGRIVLLLLHQSINRVAPGGQRVALQDVVACVLAFSLKKQTSDWRTSRCDVGKHINMICPIFS
jgi:hypothetical protein